MKLEFSVQIFKKYWSIGFQENPPMGAELSHVTDGQTHRHDGANSRFS
jgi:hypothetical protein